MHGDRCNPSLPLLPSVCDPPAQPLIATDPCSRLWTHAALQSAFMLVDFRRFWCHNEGGWHFDMAPREFHAPCVSKRLRRSAGRYSRNWSFIASAWGDYQPPLRQGWSSRGGGIRPLCFLEPSSHNSHAISSETLAQMLLISFKHKRLQGGIPFAPRKAC